MTQTEQILNHLKTGKAITPLGAIDRWGCMRLAARVLELKEMGIDVKRRMIPVINRYGKEVMVAEYRL
jgi:hypothetical protein